MIGVGERILLIDPRAQKRKITKKMRRKRDLCSCDY